MKTLQRVGLAGAAALGLMSLSTIASVTTAGGASATAKVKSMKITGLTFVEADVSLPVNREFGTDVSCPTGDVVVGGGGYEVTQGVQAWLTGSYPDDPEGTGWKAFFSNEGSSTNTGVDVAICAASSSLADYSVQVGDSVTIPSNGQAQATATCPSGTVSLGGGADNEGGATYDPLDVSAPDGTDGWRAYLSDDNTDSGTNGYAAVVCAKKPSGWKQVNSSYEVNPEGTATAVTVKCPGGRRVLGGGPFESSTDPAVNIGLTTSASNLKGWHSTEDNRSSTSESADEWAVCAKATPAPS